MDTPFSAVVRAKSQTPHAVENFTHKALSVTFELDIPFSSLSVIYYPIGCLSLQLYQKAVPQSSCHRRLWYNVVTFFADFR